MWELYKPLCIVRCDVNWTLYMKKLPSGDSGLVGSFILVDKILVFYSSSCVIIFIKSSGSIA